MSSFPHKDQRNAGNEIQVDTGEDGKRTRLQGDASTARISGTVIENNIMLQSKSD